MTYPAVLYAEFAAWMLDERGWSYQTRRTRLSTVEHARLWLHAAREVSLLSARREEVLAYVCTARHPRTRNRRLTDLRAFYRFAVERRYIRADPTGGIQRVREPRSLPRPLNHDQAVRLLRAGLLVGPRAYTIVGLLLYSGIRREEAVQLSWSDVDLESRMLRVLGKGSKERDVPVSPRLAEVLAVWRLRGGSGYVFPSDQRAGLPISPTTLWRDVDAAARVAGVRSVVCPHALRHTFASELVDEGVDVRRVQVLLGHASLATTQIYTRVRPTHLAADVARLDFAG